MIRKAGAESPNSSRRLGDRIPVNQHVVFARVFSPETSIVPATCSRHPCPLQRRWIIAGGIVLALGVHALRLGQAGAQTPAAPAPTRVDSAKPTPLVLAHYMPWYQVERGPGEGSSTSWGWHWTMNHFDPDTQLGDRRQIASHFYPAIGPYDSSDPAVLEYHLLLMKTAGIDGVIVDWYGLSDLNDYAMLHRNTEALFAAASRFGMKFSICYEDQTIPFLVQAGRLERSAQVRHAISEINAIADLWFSQPNYVRIDDKPVLLSFGNTGLSDDEWKQCVEGLKTKVAYFSEHTRRDGAVGAYDWPVPSMGSKATDRFTKLSSDWSHAIPVAFPRFVDIYAEAKVNAGYEHLDDWGGETFKQTLRRASQFDAAIVQVATWNDWGEGTQIEPSREYGFRDLEVLQSYRRKFVDPKFSARADDLRLPLSLWKMRQQSADVSDDLDAIARLIARGDFDAARQRIQKHR